MYADYASIIDRASAAATLAEECDVIKQALNGMVQRSEDWTFLSRIVSSVKAGEAPRACLLGVVASLVPEWTWGVNKWTDDGGYGSGGVSHGGRQIECDATTPALALLIAIFRALQEKEGAPS